MGERRPGIAQGVAELRARFEKAGRDPSSLKVRSTARVGRGSDGRPDVAATMSSSGDLIEVGVTDIDVPYSFFVSDDADRDRFFEQATSAIAGTEWVDR